MTTSTADRIVRHLDTLDDLGRVLASPDLTEAERADYNEAADQARARLDGSRADATPVATCSIEQLAELREDLLIKASAWRHARGVSPAQSRLREERLRHAVDAYEAAQTASRGGK